MGHMFIDTWVDASINDFLQFMLLMISYSVSQFRIVSFLWICFVTRLGGNTNTSTWCIMTSRHGNVYRVTGFLSWWRHQMETFSALLAICAGKSPVNFPHKGQWRGASMFSLICVWIYGWVNNREAGGLRRYRAHYDVTVMWREASGYPSRKGPERRGFYGFLRCTPQTVELSVIWDTVKLKWHRWDGMISVMPNTLCPGCHSIKSNRCFSTNEASAEYGNVIERFHWWIKYITETKRKVVHTSNMVHFICVGDRINVIQITQ